MITKPYQTKSAADADYYTDLGWRMRGMCGGSQELPEPAKSCKCEYGPGGRETQIDEAAMLEITVCHKCKYIIKDAYNGHRNGFGRE
jgi:hypothetical protein